MHAGAPYVLLPFCTVEHCCHGAGHSPMPFQPYPPTLDLFPLCLGNGQVRSDIHERRCPKVECVFVGPHTSCSPLYSLIHFVFLVPALAPMCPTHCLYPCLCPSHISYLPYCLLVHLLLHPLYSWNPTRTCYPNALSTPGSPSSLYYLGPPIPIGRFCATKLEVEQVLRQWWPYPSL